ncbi:MAG: hypothetical protein Q7T20_01945 [Saprospiraceae bacterium]|nr:hypothetical protein [Saprospiraceae bacterium]
MARRRSSSNSGGFLFKTGLFAALAGLAFFLFNQFGSKKSGRPIDTKPPIEMSSDGSNSEIQTPKSSLPSQVPEDIFPSSSGELVRHTWFSLGYSEDHEQAEWVAYELTRERLDEKWAERPNSFRPDPAVRTESSIDQVENSTGIDFFPQLLKGMDEELEGSLDIAAWPVNRKRYEQRVKVWNVRR